MPAPAPVALPHPLIDASGPGWAATFTRVPIVGLSSGRSALFVDAATAGVRVVLVTEPTARLTYPLFQLLRNTGGLWLARRADGSLHDAITGAEVGDLASAADPRSVVASLSDRATLSDRAMSARRSSGPEEADSTAWLQFAVSTHHAAREEAIMGGALETLVDGITGGSPLAWGTAEPVGQPWNRTAISGLVRSRMPLDTRVIVAGTGSAAFRATIRVMRSELGITEETRVVFAVTDDVARGTDDSAHLLERIADRQEVLLGSAWSMRGAADTTIASGHDLLPQPVAAVIGARGVRALGVDPATTDLPGARRAGNRRAPSLVFGFGGDETGWRDFANAIESIGAQKITSALFPNDLISGGLRHAS